MILWEDSSDYTHFLLKWSARPVKPSALAAIFIDELKRRHGLRAYGVRLPERRRSSVNQIHSGNIHALVPRQLDKPEAA